jgi:DNA invertase Pin-like site-specific DNA recombinase
MRIKYNRVSTLNQSGNRFTDDTENYDLVLLDKVSGSVGFRDRPKGKELVKLVASGKLKELVVEELSRLGRNTGDVIATLEWLDKNQVNVLVRNLGLMSRPGGERNPIWKMITAIMSSLYEMELENIKERTQVGRRVYVQNGGILGRPTGTSESERKFLEKPKTLLIIKNLKNGLTVRQIEILNETSSKTVIKAKRIALKNKLL